MNRIRSDQADQAVQAQVPMPASMQQYAPPTTDFVHQLWGNELQSGAVQSPYSAMTPQIPSPTPTPVM